MKQTSARYLEISNRLFKFREALEKAREEHRSALAAVEAERARYREALARASVDGTGARCSTDGCRAAEAAAARTEDLIAGLQKAIEDLEPLHRENQIAELQDQNGNDRLEMQRLQRELTEMEAERERLRGEVRRRGEGINKLAGAMAARDSEIAALRRPVVR